MKRAGVGLVVASLAFLAGCGDELEPFSGADACGLPVDVATTLVGTDRFTTDPPRDGLPISTDVEAYECTVSVGDETSDRVLTVAIDLDDQLGVDTFTQSIEAGDAFDVVGGEGRGLVRPRDDADRFTGVWVCGSVTGTVSGTAEGWTDEAVRGAVEDLADAAGCASAG